ncbi:hypothetical protein BLX24_24260 [Arsenicibacter rosenii]|uniref:BioF2-like acetyltransferase domain-containing protein n=2 Tax=Arsenicibacter rosenii TaxID=1750698 RepID=A0A1S2VD29_9BACT|nr:hypothetical protein BLX24_24260 [Arsenicibacter rosenii]
MPVPLRRKYGQWVVHQPLFCQFLDVYSDEPSVDIDAFFSCLLQHFRYGSVLHLARIPAGLSGTVQLRTAYTDVLALPAGDEFSQTHYSADRRRQLRRAQQQGWQRWPATDPTLMIQWFKNYHAQQIAGGVGDWAYDVLHGLTQALLRRRLATLYYVSDVASQKAQAGALVVQAFGRMIYLFNAATPAGRAGQARAWLLDRILRETHPPAVFDFESPEVPAVARFYQEFGAHPVPYYILRWNRLTKVGQWVRRLVLIIMNNGQWLM